jgi:hypothetical protein
MQCRAITDEREQQDIAWRRVTQLLPGRSRSAIGFRTILDQDTRVL